MLMQVINHDDRVVHDQAKANRQSRQRIQVNINFEKIKHYGTETQIRHQSQKEDA